MVKSCSQELVLLIDHLLSIRYMKEHQKFMENLHYRLLPSMQELLKAVPCKFITCSNSGFCPSTQSAEEAAFVDHGVLPP